MQVVTVSMHDLRIMLEQSEQRIIHAVSNGKTTKGEIVNGKRLCEILDISEPTLIRWRDAGKIPFMEIGGVYRYDVNQVIEAISKK